LLVADDCFERVGHDRLVAMTTADNASSLRALAKVDTSYVGETHHERGHGRYRLFELRASARRRRE
jgi:RimJ/RimL family protein N-acetyltransferase